MRLIAHRGGTDKHPELTLEAAAHSIALGADYVEMDIRFTRDDVPVISHDPDALHLYGRHERIDAMTLEQFAALRQVRDARYRAHTLDEVLSSGVGPILFHIKEGGERLTPILALIRRFDYERRVILGVRSTDDVERVKSFNPDMQVLAFMPVREQLDEFLRSRADIIRLWEPWVEAETAARIQAAGKRVWVMAGSSKDGTVGYTSSSNMAAWKQLGVDGVLIDRVEWGLAYR